MNSSTLYRVISLICITLGIGLCAASGSRLTPKIFKRQRPIAQLKLVKQELEATTAMLEDLEVAEKTEAETKPSETAREDPKESTKKSKAEPKRAPKPSELILNLAERVPAIKDEPHHSERETLQASVTRLERAKTLLEGDLKHIGNESPSARLSSWWALSSLPFVSGCILIILGALIARRGAQRALSDEVESGDAIDLGEALEQLSSALDALSAKLNALQSAQPRELEAIKDELQALQRAQLDPIIETRDRARQALGLARFADLFGLIAQGERRLNRAWAALVDHHLGEARSSLSGATSSIREASKTLQDG